VLLAAVAWLSSVGCGTTTHNAATEQLLVSDAVDQSVASIDFHALRGQKVYLDTQYVQHVKSVGFVNAQYIISSLRQQLAAAGARLQDGLQDADYVVEARVGALGTDRHDLIYGLPATNLFSTASAVLPGMPQLPTIPEISLAKRKHQAGSAKVAVFAYHRQTKQPVWQSGIAQARSTAKDFWILGAGPFQSGTVYEGIQLAGDRFELPLGGGRHEEEHGDRRRHGRVAYDREHLFNPPAPEPGDGAVRLTSGGGEDKRRSASKTGGDSEKSLSPKTLP